MSGEEVGGAVECGVRLFEAAVLALVDVREARPDLQGGLDIGGAPAGGQADRVVEEHLVRADLHEQRGRPVRSAKTGLARGSLGSPSPM